MPASIVKMYGDLMVFSGTANRPLAEATAQPCGVALGGADVQRFPNSNTFVRLHQSVRAKDVFLIQPTSAPVNDNLMELLIFIDTFKRDSAGRITVVVPFYGYGRTDKKDQPRVPITARLVADLIQTAGADRIVTLDLHAKQIQGFFSSRSTSCRRSACSSTIFRRTLSRTRSWSHRTSGRCAARATLPKRLTCRWRSWRSGARWTVRAPRCST